MIWCVRGPRAGEDEFLLVVSDVFVDWLRNRAQDAEVRGLDPYRDTVLDTAMLERWRDELARIAKDQVRAVADELAETRALPRDASARDAIWQGWVEQALAADEHHQTLRELAAAIALALEIGGTMHVRGD